MTLSEIIELLKQIRDQSGRTPDEVEAIDNAISLLQNKINKDQLISATKILADLFNIVIKIFDS